MRIPHATEPLTGTVRRRLGMFYSRARRHPGRLTHDRGDRQDRDYRHVPVALPTSAPPWRAGCATPPTPNGPRPTGGRPVRGRRDGSSPSAQSRSRGTQQRRPTRSRSDRRRPHRQSQPAGQAAPDRVVAGWQVVAPQHGGAAGRLAGPRSRLERTAVGARSRRPGRCRALAGPGRDEPLRVPPNSPSTSPGPRVGEPRPQRHLNAVWGVGDRPRSLAAYVAERFGVARDDLLSADLMTMTSLPPASSGVDEDLVSAPRLDNQGTCCRRSRGAAGRAQPGDYCPCWPCSTTRRVGSTSDHGAPVRRLLTTLGTS